MRFTPTKKISELEALTSATLDTTFVVGISGSTTYKISINQLTSSLDGAFATDLVTNALSNSLDTKLATTIFNTNSASFHSRINAVSSSVSTGTSGTSGTSGAQGNQGPIGPQGINGTAGSSGVQGPQGNQGVNGSNGTSGTGGTSGTNGSQGTQGPQGEVGPQGVNGTAGSSGVQGPQGNQGSNGTNGSQGTQGPQGNQGATGSGTQGAQGVSGTSGTSGVSIDSGSFATTSSLNTLSSSVDSRLDTLEASIISGSPNYTQVLGNRRTGITTTGVSIISGSITTTGNPVQIMVTGDANPVNVTSWTRLQIFRDENSIGNIVQVENSSNLNVPYCLNVIDTPSAGTYTYSMRTVSGISGLFDFGESTGPLLTAVELKTNTNLPSTNNTFTGTNRFNGQVTLGGAGGDEGGELQLATAQTNSTLTAGVVSVDVYRDRLRIFEGGGNSRGVYIDLSKAPAGNAGELMWKASGMVNAGTFVSLDNIKATVTSGSPYGLSIAAVSTTFSANISAYHAYTGGIAGGQANNQSITTTPTNSLFNWSFITEGDGAYYTIVDKTNNRMYRITMMIGSGFNNNFISIERLF
jgi:hypothetical protein